MSLLKAEMELITAPCPSRLATRPNILPWVVFRVGECQEAATVGRQQSPISASVREMTALGRLLGRNLVWGANKKLFWLFFLMKVK